MPGVHAGAAACGWQPPRRRSGLRGGDCVEDQTFFRFQQMQLLLETPPANLCVRWHEVRSRDRGHYFPVARRTKPLAHGEL